jgi:hypothetical protein
LARQSPRRVVSTHKQALSALLFLYKEELGQQLPWCRRAAARAARHAVPAVLTRAKAERLLAQHTGTR